MICLMDENVCGTPSDCKSVVSAAGDKVEVFFIRNVKKTSERGESLIFYYYFCCHIGDAFFVFAITKISELPI